MMSSESIYHSVAPTGLGIGRGAVFYHTVAPTGLESTGMLFYHSAAPTGLGICCLWYFSTILSPLQGWVSAKVSCTSMLLPHRGLIRYLPVVW
jgi:hypothetical protein